MIIRKLFSAILACVFVMSIYFIMEQSGFVILLGMYLLPILLIYGIPTSVLSDFITKKLQGKLRGGVALIIHLLLATMFVLILFLFSKWGWDNLYNFLLITSLISSSLFWCIDEIFRSQKVKNICMKIDNLKTY